MKNKPVFLYLTTILLVSGGNVFASYASCNTYAVYGAVSDSTLNTSSMLGLPAEAETLVGAGLEDYASSWTRATLDGKVSGVTEGFSAAGQDLYAHSSAVSSANWLVRSNTVAAGTPVRLWLDVLFEGQFYSEQPQAISSASVSLQRNGETIYRGSARFFRTFVTTTYSWDGSCFVENSTTCVLSAPGSLFVHAVVGDVINLTMNLQTAIECTQTALGGARTDFSSSGSYQFLGAFDYGLPSKELDVEMILIPEPAAVVVVFFGGLAALRKHPR